MGWGMGLRQSPLSRRPALLFACRSCSCTDSLCHVLSPLQDRNISLNWWQQVMLSKFCKPIDRALIILRKEQVKRRGALIPEVPHHSPPQCSSSPITIPSCCSHPAGFLSVWQSSWKSLTEFLLKALFHQSLA